MLYINGPTEIWARNAIARQIALYLHEDKCRRIRSHVNASSTSVLGFVILRLRKPKEQAAYGRDTPDITMGKDVAIHRDIDPREPKVELPSRRGYEIVTSELVPHGAVRV